MTTARLTQQAAEALLRPAPKAQFTQQAGELLLQPAPRARFTSPSRSCAASPMLSLPSRGGR